MEPAMECSEEEGSVGESEKNEDWETDGRNQMDYDQDFVDDGGHEQFEASSSAVEKSIENLNGAIRAHEMKKQALDEIIKNQVENIVELQNSCEKISYTLDQLPTLRKMKQQRRDQVLTEIQDLKSKLLKVNELIEFTIQKYDEDLMLVYSLKEEFEVQKHLNYERRTVFEADLLALSTAGNSYVSVINARIGQKQECLLVLKNHLAELEHTSIALNELNAKIDSTFIDASALNSALLEDETKLAILKRNADELRTQIDEENAKFRQKMEEYKRKELESSVDLKILCGKIEKTRMAIDNLHTDNVESKSKLTSLENRVVELEKDKQLKAAEKLALSFQLSELQDQQSTLSQTMSGLTRCKNLISAGENDIRLLEAELDRLTDRGADLEKKRSEIDEQIVAYERYVQEAEQTVSSLEEEYSKLAQDLPTLRSSYTAEMKDVAAKELNIEQELTRAKSVFSEMSDSMNELSASLEQSNLKIAELRQINESLRDSINMKRSMVIEKEQSMKSSSEELEACKAEWNSLAEELRVASETVNNVKNLNMELDKAKKLLEQAVESKKQSLFEINEENNERIAAMVRAIESTKQECLKALEEKSDELSKVEEEYNSLQSNATTYSALLKDAGKQAELFTCEKSLFQTFARWVFEDEPIAPGEDGVTSTSDAQLFADSQQDQSQELDFQVKPVKTSYK